MGRPPCCDKIGVKKGPWTPEEDIILVSYIQEHGPGNWRAVPTNTGLLRCSKSCRLRWTNYLRPGIKRGDFTEDEEKMIIHLQALLGNRWAAIASYLPQRTDNDIKKYWNTHLKKKLKKLQGQNGHLSAHTAENSSESSKSVSKGQWERRLQTDIHMAKKALCEALSLDKSNYSSSSSSSPLFPKTLMPPQQTATPAQQPPATYASSADNIARLLENWMKKSPKKNSSTSVSSESTQSISSFNNNNNASCFGPSSSPSEGAISTAFFEEAANLATPPDEESKPELGITEMPLSFANLKPELGITEMPLSFLEKWLLEDAAGQGQEGDFMDMALGETADLF